jgi:hypothetical protein
MPKSQKRLKAEELIGRFPNTGNSPLADILLKENPLLFDNKEDARTTLRVSRGTGGGKRHKSKMAKEGKTKKLPVGRHNPYNLPDEEHNNFKPLIIGTKKPISVGVLNDIHFPYQDNTALSLALDYLRLVKPEIIILNGDILDCYSESSFTQDPSKRKMKEEILIVRNFLDTLRKTFPTSRIIFKEGNHEFRHKSFLARKAPEIFGIEEFRLEKLLGLEEFGIEWIDNKRLIEVGKLTVVHGHEFGRGFFAPVNPARGFYSKAKKSVMGGHHHQISSHSAKTINGHQHVAYSVGCLCDITPEYAPINEWSHGFAIIDLNPDGTFVVHNKKIINRTIVNG